jgi:phage gp36-like protein
MKVKLHGKAGLGKFCLIDDDDYKRISKITGRWSIAGTGYVQVWDKVHKAVFLLHRIIMGHPVHMVDHINGDKLDNRKDNLRTTADGRIHGRNKKPRVPKSQGVCWDKKAGKWMARMQNCGKSKFLGYFDDKNDARRAYRDAVLIIDPLLVQRFAEEWADL